MATGDLREKAFVAAVWAGCFCACLLAVPAFAESGEAPPDIPTISETSDNLGVVWASRKDKSDSIEHAVVAEFGDTLEVHFKDLDIWFAQCMKRGWISPEREATPEAFLKFAQSLCLSLNDIPFPNSRVESIFDYVPPYGYHPPRVPKEMAGVPPEKLKAQANADTVWHVSWKKWNAADPPLFENPPQDRKSAQNDPNDPRHYGLARYHVLRFKLSREKANSDIWADVLRFPWKFDWGHHGGCGFARRMGVGVAFLDQDGKVFHEAPTWVRPTESTPNLQFSICVVPWRQAGISLLGIFTMGLIGWKLIKSPTFLRNPTTRPRPDGLQPLSLTKCQAAYWGSIVLLSFCFIWLVLDKNDSINSTAATLVGIGTATLFAGAVTGCRYHKNGLTPEEALLLRPHRLWPESPEKILRRIRAQETLAPERRALLERLAKTPRQSICTSLCDLVMEPAAENEIPQHSLIRLQMVAWNAVFGLVFIYSVLSTIQMPEWNLAIFALLGINTGGVLTNAVVTGRRRRAQEEEGSEK